jgi:hypothetical protein
LREKLRQVKETIARMMHRPIAEQGLYLKQVMNAMLLKISAMRDPISHLVRVR